MKENRRKFMSNLGTREEAIGAMETQEDDGDDEEEEEKDGKQTEGGMKEEGFCKGVREEERRPPGIFQRSIPLSMSAVTRPVLLTEAEW
jgi:hypothetical protein